MNRYQKYRLKNSEKVKLAKKNWEENNYDKHRKSANLRSERYRLKNREKIREYGRIYSKLHRDKNNTSTKKWREKNKNNNIFIERRRLVRNIWHKNKIVSDPIYKISMRLRGRLSDIFRGKISGKIAIEYLGCSLPELKMYLEGQFKDGMNWNNHGLHGWHVDHKIPLSFFDLTNEKQISQACHYTNLQPLWATENRKKHAKLLPEFNLVK